MDIRIHISTSIVKQAELADGMTFIKSKSIHFWSKPIWFGLIAFVVIWFCQVRVLRSQETDFDELSVLQSNIPAGQDTQSSVTPAASTTSTNRSDSFRSGFSRLPSFGGPDAPQVRLRTDDQVSPTSRLPFLDQLSEPWFDWKRRLNDRNGIELGGYYMNVYQGANQSLTDINDAYGGKFRLTSIWVPGKRKTGNYGRLAFTFDHRHKYGEIANTELAEQIGFLGQTQVVLSNAGSSIIHLNWAQRLRGDDAGFIIGRIDPNDYLDVLGYSSPWTGFFNSTIQLNASLSFQQSSWGVLAGNWFNDQWYAIGTVNDANGFAEDNLEFFAGGAEFFVQGEIGWAPSQAERLNRKVSLSLWHKDARVDAGKDYGQGLLFSAGWTFEQWTTFFRGGISKGGAPAFNQSVSAGFLYRVGETTDQLGLGINWGNPSNRSLPQQTSSECFYRYQLSQNVAFSPSIQWINNPALNPVDDQLWVYGIRLRATF